MIPLSKYTGGARTDASHPAGKLRGGGDDLFIITGVLLTAFGLTMVYSSSGFKAIFSGRPDWFYFLHQFKVLLVGVALFLWGFKTPSEIWRRYVKIGMLAWIVVMTVQLFMPASMMIKGTRRWIDLGVFTLQTSEVARALIIVYLARLLSDEPELASKPNGHLLFKLAPVGVLMVLTFLQPDLSSTAMIGAVAMILLFLGGLPLIYFGLTVLLGAAGFAVLAMFNPYQWERVIGFLSPLKDIHGDQYQIWHSLIGFARGGLFGVGLGNSSQKMLYLPESHSDFIVSIIGEELGLLGTTAVLLAFMVIFVRGVRICLHLDDRFRSLLGMGLVTSITLMALVNIAVAIRLLPVTGLPLPLISSGGTSLVLTLWALGIVWRLSQEARFGSG